MGRVAAVLARHAVSIDNPFDDPDAHLRNLKTVTSTGFLKNEVSAMGSTIVACAEGYTHAAKV
jgi:hypothetical protein